MNRERIRELAEQVWREILDETSIDGDISTTFSPDEVVAFEQKFAELIVKKCATVITNALEDGPWPGKLLKEHFGVE